MGQCFESSHEGYADVVHLADLAYLAVCGFEGSKHIWKTNETTSGVRGPAEIVSLMLILKVWRAYDAQTCPDYLPPELRL